MESFIGSRGQLGPSATLEGALGEHIGRQNDNSLIQPYALILKDLLFQTASPEVIIFFSKQSAQRS